MDEKEINIVGGYIPDAPDPNRYSYGAVFGAPDYPRKFVRPLPPGIKIPYQGKILSCVLCTFSFLNQFKSMINDGLNLVLSWRKPFSATGPYNTGRNLESVAKYLASAGQPQDRYCPNDPNLPEAEFMNTLLSQEGEQDSMRRIIGPHWWVDRDIPSLCRAVIQEPIMVTFGGINADWRKPFDQIVTQSNSGADWYHAVTLWDYDLDAGYFRIINWWGDEIRKISINFLFTGALSFRDIPDNDTTMLKVIKLADKNDNYVITGDTKRRIPDSDTYHYFAGQLGMIGSPVTVSQAEFAKFKIGEALPSVKLMRAFEPIAKDIFYEE